MYDAMIVGGGPAGLNAALILGRCRRRVVLFDSGAPRNAAAHKLHGYLGHDGIKPSELLALGRRELAKYSVEIVSDTVHSAEPLRRSPEHPFNTGFVLHTAGGRAMIGRKLLLATGVVDTLPDVPGLRECYGRSVHHCPYCDGWEHADEHLLAWGKTAQAAAGLGLLLRTWTSRVTVLLRSAPLESDYRQRLAHNGVAICDEPVVELLHNEGRLTAARLASGESLPATGLFFNTSYVAHSDLPAMLGCEFAAPETAATSNKQQTCVSGLFLAGDADGEVQFAIVAAAEGASAGVAINRELQDEDQAAEARNC